MRRSPSGSGSAARRSSAHRNAASVLPEPVGAEISTCSPVAIAGQACAWAGVGSANAPVNQSRTPGLKKESVITREPNGGVSLAPIIAPE